MKVPVILDTDIGSDIDDTWALAMLLRCPELDLKLVLTDTSNTIYRARVTAKMLEIAGRIDVPVGVGICFASANEFQLPWVTDYQLEDYPGKVYHDGVQAMIDLIRQSIEPVTIIGIGPSPNLLKALNIAPDIAKKCRFVGMFGSFERGYGDNSDPVAETNVREDIEAARSIFAAPWQEILITPLDTCDQVILSGNQYQAIQESNDPLLRAVMENYRIWSELVTWVNVDFFNKHTSTLFDTVAVYLAYSTEYVRMESISASITDEGKTVYDPDGSPLQVALSWRNLTAFKAHLVQRLLG
ncbi:MAG: nucleoside hydrolase [Aggregatilineales bacterium]